MLSDITNQQGCRDHASQQTHGKNQPKALEEVYQKLTPIEHILKRPDTYIGSTEIQQQEMWVYSLQEETMKYRSISFVPGLYKIFDEILVNAADNKQRDNRMNRLEVDIDKAKNTIRIWNNGQGIPVEMHKTEKIYVPELIFGHLLTSSNYDDEEAKVTGGRNGYGAKLTNIYSTEFTVETCDGKKRFKQTFRNNMTIKGAHEIKAAGKESQFTCVTFRPDLQRFKLSMLDEDMVELMAKRVMDMVGFLTGVKVFFNRQQLRARGFEDYVSLYLGADQQSRPRFFFKADRWQVCASASRDETFEQVSMVNAIATTKGGNHVNSVSNQLAKGIAEKLNKKNKGMNISAAMVKNQLWLCVNCLIVNPTFDSQTKEYMTLKQSQFGSQCELPQKFIDQVAASELGQRVVDNAQTKANRALKKSDGKRVQHLSVPKLDDANLAGGAKSGECTLILTEGDSAKALAISGLSVVGRDRYGVFPLKGKPLNVRDASHKVIEDNQELKHIKQILGLRHGQQYQSASQLRYGKLMLMTDQDHDGSHIKGLLINLLHHLYPSLLQLNGFLQEFITPIIRVTKKQGDEPIVRQFYTMPEYEAWKESAEAKTGAWSVKYYKGLGTSTPEDAKQYFRALNFHRKQFWHAGQEDDRSIDMAFNKKKADDRKQWMSQYQEGDHLDHSVDTITYSDFINKELILFSRADLERSVPSMCDGLKPGQRKVLFCAFKRNLEKDVKVAQLSGYISEHSAYHHGEVSLQSTIVNLAQDYVGSNNLPLLTPSGMFGTRLMGGKDSASARYIFTRLAPLTRKLFRSEDEPLLNFKYEEGQRIEPTWYLPILPTVLFNGCDGIGTGYSTQIPNYNPIDVVNNVRRLLSGEEQVAIHPWYRGYSGAVVQDAKGYTFEGRVQLTNPDWQETSTSPCFRITELPVKTWTTPFKDTLNKQVTSTDNKPPVLRQPVVDHGTEQVVDLALYINPEYAAAAAADPLNFFKLTKHVSTGNMMLFDHTGKVKKYETAEDIVAEFFPLRLRLYQRRRKHLLKLARNALTKWDNQRRYILAIIDGRLQVMHRKRAEVERDLHSMGFDRIAGDGSIARNPKPVVAEPEISDDEEGEVEGPRGRGQEDAEVGQQEKASFDYLLKMSIEWVTEEKVAELEESTRKKREEFETLQATNPQQMWGNDLDEFEEAYNQWMCGKDEEQREQLEAVHNAKHVKAGAKKGNRGKKLPKPNMPPTAKPKKQTTTNGLAEAGPSGLHPAQQAAAPKVMATGKPQKGGGAGGSKKLRLADSDMEDSEIEIQDSSDLCDDGDSDDFEITAAAAEPQAPKREKPSRRAAANRPTMQDDHGEDSDDQQQHATASDLNVTVCEEPQLQVKTTQGPSQAPSKARAAHKRKQPGLDPPGFIPTGEKQSADPFEFAIAGEDCQQGGQQGGSTKELSPPPSPAEKVRKMRASPFNKKSGKAQAKIPKPIVLADDDDVVVLNEVDKNVPQPTNKPPTKAPSKVAARKRAPKSTTNAPQRPKPIKTSGESNGSDEPRTAAPIGTPPKAARPGRGGRGKTVSYVEVGSSEEGDTSGRDDDEDEFVLD